MYSTDLIRFRWLVLSILLGSLCLLSVMTILGGTTQAAPLRNPGTGTDPAIEAITVTASLPISDTRPHEGITKTVYFNNSGWGVITLTFEISGTTPLTLTAGTAFNDPAQTLTSATSPWSPVVTHSVETGGGDWPGTGYTATNASGVQTVIAITYTRDVTGPSVPTPNEPTTGTVVPSNTVAFAWGAASDDLSGVAGYTIVVTGSTQIYSDTVGNVTSTLLTLGPNGVYTWGVQAIDAVENESGFGNPIAFTVNATPTVDFSSGNYSVSESVGAATITVTLNDVSVLTVTVDYATSDGTATAGSDYATTTGTLTFSPGTTSLTFTVPITDDLADENSETITLTLSNESNATTGANNPATLTIADDDTTVYLPIISRNYPPAWKQGSNTNNIRFYSPSGCGSNAWYAGTWDRGVWKSTDSAQTWSQIVSLSPYPYPVVANPNDCTQAFAAVWGSGIYRITGSSSQAINNGLGETYIYGLAATGTTLYAGTNSQGVYKTDINTIAWQARNTNINELRIRSLAAIGSEVYAGARACTVYKSTNGGASWSEKIVPPSGGCNDAQVWSVAKVKTTLYAGLADKGLYYYNAGSGWQRVTDVPTLTVYGLADDGTNGYLYVSTYGAGVYRCRVDGTGVVQQCQQHNPGLTTLNMREMKIHNSLLVAGSDDGIWYVPLFR